MAKNGNSEQLSPKQVLFLSALLTPLDIQASAKVAGVSERQAHRWIRQEHFQAALKAAKQQIYQAAIQELQLGLTDAIRALKKHAIAEVEPSASSTVKALTYLIDKNILLEDIESLKAKIALIEDLHKKDK